MPLHFGLQPAQRLPALGTPADAAVLAAGIGLYSEPDAAQDARLIDMLADEGFLTPTGERVLIVDVPAGDRLVARRLIRHATVHVCPLTASPDCVALLPQVLEDTETSGAGETAFVIGRLDETKRLARHVAAFSREILGSRLVAKIRQDQSVPEAIAMLQVLSRYAPSSAALADAQAAAQAIGAMIASARGGEETPAAEETASPGAALAKPSTSRAA
jgi:hypothetical protein